MGRKTILSFDPGKASGYCYAWFDENTPVTRYCTGIIGGGAQGLDDFIVGFIQNHGKPSHLVSEWFIPDGGPGGRETVSPRGEGVLISRFGEPNIVWQKRSEKAWGYDSQKKTDQKLQKIGWWVTGADVGHEDGRDANDAAAHLIQWMRKRRHIPTLRMLYA